MTEASLHDDAMAILTAGIAAVDPRRLVREFLAEHPSELAEGPVHVVAVGKAAAAMAAGARESLGDRILGGIILLPEAFTAEAPPGFAVHGGGHPIPSQAGLAGAAAIRSLAAGLAADDHLLGLISGGGSALMTLPPTTIELAELQQTTDALLRAGATIGELNAVRKHLDRLKGGRLARLAAPATSLGLLLSDVVGDPPDVIASGPLSPDPTTFTEAIAVCRRYRTWAALPPAVRAHLERGARGLEEDTPKAGEPCFDRVSVRIVGNNRIAADAALAEAAARGYRPLLLTTTVEGEARELGALLAAMAREVRTSGHPAPPPLCLLAAGEPTVTVRGRGKGGRNQEVALGAAERLAGLEEVLIAAVGTDGVDGPTDAAGALASGSTTARARTAGLDPAAALADNDAYPFFDALDDLIRTGPTGTNVMDLQIVLVGQAG